MTDLYPLQFEPLQVTRAWGGEKWLLCGLEGHPSVVCKGFLKDNEINELIEVYMGDLVGDPVYQKFGNEFPLLIKTLDIQDYLSIQVHPSDTIAKERHNAYGKAEAWVVMDAQPDARVYLGFNRPMNPADLVRRCQNQTLPEVMNEVVPNVGDCYYIPPGTIHGAGGGLVVAEVQQVSDITYRIFDWGREFYKETAREMHIDLAIDAIDWEPNCFDQANAVEGGVQHLVSSPWFHLSKRVVSAPVPLANTFNSSFRLVFCTKGEVTVVANDSVVLKKGEVVLIPAAVSQYSILPNAPDSEVLEIYIL
ncbi:MAG: class I mannose-6-phosphate isomerase [Prevotellaceae bacterium]|jgi:mannose-6-phosphate isomerase|nr:class I mannose-6-phosphate isomerase [Prevotellaceae bacterium]